MRQKSIAFGILFTISPLMLGCAEPSTDSPDSVTTNSATDQSIATPEATDATVDALETKGTQRGVPEMVKSEVVVTLPEGWSDRSADNPVGPLTYIRNVSSVPGALQISLAEYTGGHPTPNLDAETLIALAKRLGKSFGTIIEESTGLCAIGTYGTVRFSSDTVAHAQVWCLTNQESVVLVTHICQQATEQSEIDDVQSIVLSLRLSQTASSTQP